MTFLNPFILFGLAAASIPILIHMLNRRKLRTIEFSTLAFLKELQKNKMRKITIRQWLLLLLRTLIIVFLVLAFSRPALHGTIGSGSHAASTIVIILDNTASMGLRNEHGKYLTQAQDEALRIASMVENNDDAFLVRLSDLPDATLDKPTHDIGKLTRLIRETDISYSSHTIDEAVHVSAGLIAQSKNLNKELYIITDGQASTFKNEAAQQNNKAVVMGAGVKVFYTLLSDHPAENFAVERTIIPPAIVLPNKPLTIKAVVKNYGTTATSNHLVSVTLDGHRVAQKNVTVGAGESKTIDFSVTPERTGFNEGYIESEDDLFEPDNKRFFTLYVPSRVRALLVSSGDNYSRYITTTLSLPVNDQWSTPVSLTSIRTAQLTSTLIQENDVVIFSGVPALSESYYPIVRQHIRSGGGMIFFPSDDTVSVQYPLLEAFGISTRGVTFSHGSSFSTINKVDFDSPLFSGMFESARDRKEPIESPEVHTSLAVQRSVSLQPILSLSNGNPFLWQQNIGSGMLIGFSVPATQTWSNLPVKGLFVPLMFQSILYLVSQNKLNTAASDYLVGEPIEFSSSLLKRTEGSAANDIQAYDSQGRSIPISNATATGGNVRPVLSLQATNEPGIYTVTQQKDTVLAAAVNIPTKESETALIEKGMVAEVLTDAGIQKGDIREIIPGEDIHTIVHQSRFGTELWKYFVILACIVALLEMLVAREKKDL